MRPGCLKTIHDLMLKDDRVVFIGSDIGVGLLDTFKDIPPGRVWMEGISEQNIIGLAAGLAQSGKIVYVAAIAAFLTRRAYEQIALDIALPRLPVRLIGLGGGAMYATEGPTHTATDDIALMRNLGVTVLAPADKVECAALVSQTLDYPGPVYVRLGWGEPLVTDGYTEINTVRNYGIFPNRCEVDVRIITTGNMLRTCMEARDILKGHAIVANVTHCPMIKDNPNYGFSNDCQLLVTVEEGITSGLGGLIAEHYPVAYRFGLPMFPEGNGGRLDMLKKYKLTAEDIAKKVEELVHG